MTIGPGCIPCAYKDVYVNVQAINILLSIRLSIMYLLSPMPFKLVLRRLLNLVNDTPYFSNVPNICISVSSYQSLS